MAIYPTMQQQLYAQAISQQQAQAINSGLSTACGAGGYGTSATSLPNVLYSGQIAGTVVTNPTRHAVSIAFTDVFGVTHALHVDSAYVAVLAQVSQYHLGQYPYHAQSSSAMQQAVCPSFPEPKFEKMVDGDFSLDELDQAEKIMDELRA